MIIIMSHSQFFSSLLNNPKSAFSHVFEQLCYSPLGCFWLLKVLEGSAIFLEFSYPLQTGEHFSHPVSKSLTTKLSRRKPGTDSLTALPDTAFSFRTICSILFNHLHILLLASSSQYLPDFPMKMVKALWSPY